MRQLKLKMMFAWLAVLSIAMTGSALAQPTMPSLVTQQQRLSTGGATPGYVQLRPKLGVTGIGTYFWDQAPTPTSGVNYSMWLDASNNIETSAPFGLTAGAAGTGGAFYLYRVNATGTGLEWVKPSAFVEANNGLSVDSTTIPGTDIVQFGGPSTSPSALLSDRYIDQAAHAVNFTGAANSAMNIGNGNIYNFTLDVGTAAGGNMTLKNILANSADTTFLTLDNAGNVKTRALSSLVVADNGLSINPVGGFVELGGPLIKATSIAQATFALSLSDGTLALGNGTTAYNVNVDVGATGNVNLKNILANIADTTLLTLDNSGNVKTRGISTLVGADNGLFLNTVAGTPTVELGGAATNTAPLLVNRFVTLGGKAMNFDGTGNFNVGDGTSKQDIAIDPSATGSLELHNIAQNVSATKFLVLGGNDSVRYRDLSSLVVADNGLSINAVGGFVELGGPVATPATFLSDRYIDQAGKILNFSGAANSGMIIGSGNVYNFTLDVGTAAGGNMTLKNILANNADTTILTLDATGNVKTRGISTLVGADNGLFLNTASGTPTVELGGAATATAPLLGNRFVTLSGKALNFDGAGNFNIGDGTSKQDIAIDPSATGTLRFHNLLATTSNTKLVVLGGGDSVMTRDLSTLVVADNGLTINATGGFVELGSIATGGAPLLRNSVVTMGAAGKDMTFDGNGNFTVGGAAFTESITLDPGAAGSTNLKDLATITPAANNRFVVLDATDKAFTRTLNSFVLANQGVTIDSTTTPGISTVQLGSAVNGNSVINTNRFITFTGTTPSLDYNGTGILNLGTTGNLGVNVNTGTSDMTIQGANLTVKTTSLDNANINNFAWIDSTTNIVHRATTAALVRDNTVADFVGISATGQIVRSISPTNGIYRGHVAWTSWNQTITLGAGQTILANASITVTIENHASQGTVPIQVTNVAAPGGNTFDVAASDDPTPGSYINYIVMNP